MVCTRHKTDFREAIYLLDGGIPEALMPQGFNTPKVTMMMLQRYTSIRVVLKYSSFMADCDVWQLQYHPTETSILLSGSTDGLVNLYNTTVLEEEDALHQTLNHGSSIHKAGFLNDLDIFALSHDEKFAIYPMITNTEASVEEPPSTQFGDLRESLGCEYVASVFGRPSGGVVGIGNHR